MADSIDFYKFNAKVSISTEELLLELSSKPTCLSLRHTGWIQSALSELILQIQTSDSLNFLQDRKPSFQFISDSTYFSSAEILHDLRLANPGEWCLGRENQYMHLFWVLDSTACRSEIGFLNKLLDFAITQMGCPESTLCEYRSPKTPASRDQLVFVQDPLELCYSGDGDSTDYFLYALNSVYLLLHDVKDGEYIFVNSAEYVPVVPK